MTSHDQKVFVKRLALYGALCLAFLQPCVVLAGDYRTCDPITVVDFTLPMFEGLDAEAKGLLSEYAQGAVALQKFYENIVIRGESETTSTVDSAAVVQQDRLDYFASNSEYFRLELFPVNGPPVLGVHGMAIIRPEEQFLFAKDATTGEFFLKANGKHFEAAMAELRHQSFHAAPYTDELSGVMVSHLLLIHAPWRQGAKLQVQSVIPSIGESGERLVSIVLASTSAEAPQDAKQSYHFVFSRDQSWALQSMTSEATLQPYDDAPNGYAERYISKCSYAGELDGFPLLKTFESTRYTGLSSDLSAVELLATHKFVVTEIKPAAATPDQFDVQQYLGRRVEQPAGRVRQGWWLVALNGLAFLLIGVFLARRKRKQQTQPANVSNQPGESHAS